MKRKILMGSIALCGALAVVGSGFSSWYFKTEDVKTTGTTVSTYVQPLVDGIGTLTDENKDDKIYVVLDQGGYTNASVATKGISLHKGTVEGSTVTIGDEFTEFSVKYEITDDDVTKLVDAGITSGTLTATIELNSDVKTYLQFKSGYKAAESGTTTIESTLDKITYTVVYNYSSTSTTHQAESQEFKLNVSTTDLVNSLLEYKSKPTTTTDYNNMKTALDGKSAFTITYSYNVNTNTENN